MLDCDVNSCHRRHCNRSEIRSAGFVCAIVARLNPWGICDKTQKHGGRSDDILSSLRSSLPIVAPFFSFGRLPARTRPWPHVTGFKPQSLTFPYVSYVLSYRHAHAHERTHVNSHAFVHAHRPLKSFTERTRRNFCRVQLDRRPRSRRNWRNQIVHR